MKRRTSLGRLRFAIVVGRLSRFQWVIHWLPLKIAKRTSRLLPRARVMTHEREQAKAYA